MSIFNVKFTNEEIAVLSNKNLIIKNNERNYLYKENEVIPAFAIPVYYELLDFKYVGSNWVSLIEKFAEWFIFKIDQEINLLNLRNRNNKNIFSNTKKKGFAGPLSNGMFIVSNYGVRTWQLINDLISNLNIKKETHIIVHFPFHREDSEIGNLIWKKELRMFIRYLRFLGYSKERAWTHLNVLLKLNKLYKKDKRRVDSYGYILDITNPYVLTVDGKIDLSNLVSVLKRLPEFKEEFVPTIENMIDFKKELIYKDKNYTQIETKFLKE